MSGIQLFAGLGNPGKNYDTTRHNAGFWWLDTLAAQHAIHFKAEAKFFGALAKHDSTWLLKPATYMNASGRAVAALAQFYKIPATQILIIHDELDLPPGVCKLKKGGGHGGHNGLKNIAAQLGSNDFWRLRLGIGHPGDRNQVVNYVLHPPGKADRAQIDTAIADSTPLFNALLQGQFDQAMQTLHSKN
ncbi:MAG: aminoacyl-tRNA hydrolase [Methylococcales bacterium]|nr:aminoacyl-tRNA hydrolase [Methylococcales bacterium]